MALGIGVLVFTVALFLLLRHGMKTWSLLFSSGWARAVATVGVLATGTWAVMDAGHHLKYWKFDKSPPGTAWTSRLFFNRWVEMQATTADLIAFRRDARNDPMRGLVGALDRLEGRDVLVFWVESYGPVSYTHLTLPTIYSV